MDPDIVNVESKRVATNEDQDLNPRTGCELLRSDMANAALSPEAVKCSDDCNDSDNGNTTEKLKASVNSAGKYLKSDTTSASDGISGSNFERAANRRSTADSNHKHIEPTTTNNSSTTTFTKNNFTSSKSAWSEESAPLVPDPSDLILALNSDCGFDAFFKNLTAILSTYFGAQRVTLALPTDPTDIVNIPWGLRAVYNNIHSSSTPKSSESGRSTGVPSPGGNSKCDEDEWHTEDDISPTPIINVIQPSDNISTADILDIGRRASLKHKLTERVTKRLGKIPSPLKLDNRKYQSYDDTSSITASVESKDSDALPSDNESRILVFDELRPLSWETDCLIDAHGVVNMLDIDHTVVLQRKYLSPMTDKCSFIDSEQILFSPWAKSPAPSPAVKEYSTAPFFTSKLPEDEMSAAFHCQDGADKSSNSSLNSEIRDTIGFEDTYTIIHILLVIPALPDFSNPSKSFDAKAAGKTRTAPVAILSLMSNIIPFPNEVKDILNVMAPHIATSFLQARAHSAMRRQIDSLLFTSAGSTLSPDDTNRTGQLAYGHKKSLSSPYNTTFPKTKTHPRKSHTTRRNNHSASSPHFPVDDPRQLNLGEKVYYSSLKDDKSIMASSHTGIFDSAATVNCGSRSSKGRLKVAFGRRKNRTRFYHFLDRSARCDKAKERYILGASSNDTLFSSEQLKLDNRNSVYSELYAMSSAPKQISTDGNSHFRRYEDHEVEMVNPSNKLLRTIIDAIPVHVFTAEPLKGRITWASNRTLAFRGLTAVEFCKDPISSIHADDKNDYVEAWNEALRRSTPLGRMFRVRRFDGQYRVFFMRAVPLRDEKGLVAHWFCTMMDIHNKHQSEVAALQIAHETAWEQKYKFLAESTPIIVFMVNTIKGMIYANKKWLDYSGRGPKDTLGFEYLSAVHPDDRDKAIFPLDAKGRVDMEKFKGAECKDGTFAVEIRIMNKEGQYRWHLTMFTCSGDLTSPDALWFGTSTDIQDQKMIQKKLKEAKDAAQRTIETKTRFLSNMSHEIRTPLIGISGMVSFLLDTPLTEEQLDYCHTISSSSETLLMVINDILDLSKVESGKMTLQYSWFFVRRLVEEVNELLSSMAISKNLELNNTIAHNVPMWVKGDRIRLRQVILNLIGNAIKFTDRGEIYTYCSVDSFAPDGSYMMLKVEVHDTGRGFTSEDAAKRMFKPYSQIGGGVMPPGGDSTAGTSGTGLGLVISRQLIELHGGALTCEGVKGQGSTFQFTAKVMLPTDEDHPSEEELKKHELLNQNAVGTIKKHHAKARDLQILVICAWPYTCKSIEHHIRATLEDPGSCEIKFEDGFSGMVSVLETSRVEDKKWSHIVLNSSDIAEVEQMLDYLAQGSVTNDSHLIVLTSPTQRQSLMKTHGEKLKNGIQITYLPKPLKPSRYSVVFDPNRKREESRDIKMQSAHQALVAQRTVFDDLKNFAEDKKYHFLLAEDNLVNQKVMSKFLSRAGIDCSVATDGEVCTELFFESPSKYDLILCDLDMPRKDGFQVCQEIRKWEHENPDKEYTSIVALSAYVMSDVMEKCDNAGFDMYISKPVEFGALKDAIVEIMSSRKQRGI